MTEALDIALALVERDGLWLVSRRAEGRIFAGLWEFPGGKMLPGESPAQAAIRETREETGASVEAVGSLGDLDVTHEGGRVRLHLVLCRWVAGMPQPGDPAVTEIRWVTVAELATLPMPPANVEIVRLISGAGSV